MTAAHPAPVPTRAAPDSPRRLDAAGRLLRLELRRNAMLWMLPLTAALFWLVNHRQSMAYPPLWNVRAMTMQTTAVAVLAPTVVGAAAWTGSREGRHGLADLVVGTARPRWARQLAAWAATTGWAIVAYLGCVAAVYGATAWQGAWGGPLWWPAVVGAASVPAFAALGFAAGALRPSRFTPPLVAVGAFLALELGAQFIHGDRSYWQISPLVAGPWEIGPNEGAAIFHPYLPDLPIAQVIFLAGLTAALLGVLGLPVGSGGRWLLRCAVVITAVGLLAAGSAVALAGTGRLGAHGMISIPALHDPADDRPIRYTPVCSNTPIPVCLHPAYSFELSVVADALEPVLDEVAGLPGAPVRIEQVAANYAQGADNTVEVRADVPSSSGATPVLHLLLPNQLPGPHLTGRELAATVATQTGHEIVASVVGAGRRPTSAQQAVTAAILKTFATEPDAQIAAAAQRFAALPSDARRAWLREHLAALRAGHITLAQLP
ncbi:hypothetical protein [Micromonospora narathiwatensis]|uniref:ABC-type transport system involved in multi-copper enzyme maturation, permease component n=1 Tax=Micromonospora narathiwatensis TaxID=299146 RepID=A0A1A8ZKP7_9ACTN|nr:hypothetical protein [Micromonospora narathiwatensis]SBT44423.1 hypothetical protein GA0070621_2064 [Micromonospora narathiwatensis]